jgi:hypothetical protein
VTITAKAGEPKTITGAATTAENDPNAQPAGASA